MADDDIPETPEEGFKKAVLRASEPRFYRLVGKTAVACNITELTLPRVEGLAQGIDPWCVAVTEVGGGRTVSTVFLGFDHRHYHAQDVRRGRPIFCEEGHAMRRLTLYADFSSGTTYAPGPRLRDASAIACFA